MLDIACGKSGHSSALLNVDITFQFLECRPSIGYKATPLISEQCAKLKKAMNIHKALRKDIVHSN